MYISCVVIFTSATQWSHLTSTFLFSSVPTFLLDIQPLQTKPPNCSETSGTNHVVTLRSILAERKPHIVESYLLRT